MRLKQCPVLEVANVVAAMSFFFLEISFITHSTEEKTRFGPKAAARPVRNSREE